jgi:hypothetical protein
MQVLLKRTNEVIDTRCSVCGQGFALYWERETLNQKHEALREVEQTLRNHHAALSSEDAHPDRGFLVPEWNGPVAFSGAAILGNAPSWAL